MDHGVHGKNGAGVPRPVVQVNTQGQGHVTILHLRMAVLIAADPQKKQHLAPSRNVHVNILQIFDVISTSVQI